MSELHQLKDVRSLIELVLILWTLELGQRILRHLPMIIHFRVKPLPVLRSYAGRIENMIRLPPIAVPIGSIPLKPALLGLHLAGLQMFISVAMGRNGILVRTDVCGLGSAAPLLRLNREGSTTQAGCGVWISVLPYL